MAESTMSKATKIKWIVTIVLTLAVYLIPTNDIYTKQISLFFTVTVFGLLLMAFEFFDPLVVSVVMPMGWVLFGVTNAAGAMSGWTNSIIYMCVGAYFMANALEETGLLRRVAVAILSKMGNGWTVLLFGIFFASLVLTIMTFGMAYIIMATLCVGMIKSLDLKLQSREAALIGFACLLGSCCTRSAVYTPANYGMTIAQAQLVDPTFMVSPLQAMMHNWPMILVCMISLFVVSKIWKVDISLKGSEYFKAELKDMGKMSVKEKKSSIFMVIFFALLIATPVLKVDPNLLFALAPWVLLLPGINVATEHSIRHLNWQSVFFIGACMAIGNVATQLGIGDIIAKVAMPIMTNLSTLGFFGMEFVMTFVLNFFMTPLAIWSLTTVPMCQIALEAGMSLYPVVYGLIVSSEAIFLPYEFIPYLVVYSFGMMSMSDFIKFNLVRCVIFLLGILFLLVPYWMIIGLL